MERNAYGERLYTDMGGVKCNIRGMINREPAWVASRFDAMEDEIDALKARVAELEGDDKPIGGWQYIDTLVEYDGVAKAELAALRATLEEYEKANRGLADINGALTIRNLELKKAIAQTIATYKGSNEQLHRELEASRKATIADCAKAVCEGCREGWEIKNGRHVIPISDQDRDDFGPITSSCDAAAIWALEQ